MGGRSAFRREGVIWARPVAPEGAPTRHSFSAPRIFNVPGVRANINENSNNDADIDPFNRSMAH